MASVSWLEKLQEGFCKQKEQKRSTPDKTRYAFPPSPPPINVERHGWMFFSERKNSFRRRTLLGGGRGGPGSKRMRTLVLSGVVRIRARCVSPCATTCCALLAGPQLCSCAGVRLSSAALGGGCASTLPWWGRSTNALPRGLKLLVQARRPSLGVRAAPSSSASLALGCGV